MPFEITGRCEAAYLAVRCSRRTAACRTRCHRHAGYNNGGGAKPLIPQYIAERQQCFAVILDHATSLTHRCFFRRPTRKITVPLKRGTPRSRPLGSTSLQPAVRDGRGCLTGAMRTSENSAFQALR
jgi:hypothetical protein